MDERTRDGILQLSDPRVMRALAHPLRLQMLDHLRHDGPATATRLAAALGESTASMSYHLSQLDKHGLIEEAPEAGRGRERPWRARHRGISFRNVADGAPGLLAASRLLRSRVVDRHVALLDEYFQREDDFPAEWQDAAGYLRDQRVHVTAAELRSLSQEIGAVLDRYRRPDPGDRPEGAGPVMVVLYGLPRFDPEDDA